MSPFTTLKRAALHSAVIALLLAVAGGARAQGKLPGCHGLSIAVSENLKNPVKDARDTETQFRQQQGTLYKKVDWDRRYNEQATLAAIQAGFNRLVDTTQRGDHVVITLAGHGSSLGTEWVFGTADHKILRGSDLLDSVGRLTVKGATVLVIIDSCHAGAFRQQAQTQLIADLRSPGKGGLIVMLSCMPQEDSLDGANNGVFTQALLEGLRGAADFDHDGWVTLAELRLYITQRVVEISASSREVPALEVILPLPGLPHHEQHPDCIQSPAIPESLRVAKVSGPASAAPVSSAATATRPGTLTRGNDMVGKWKTTVTIKAKDGKENKLAVVYEFDDNNYTISRQDPKSDNLLQLYKSMYAYTGGTLILVTPNTVDKMPVTWAGTDKFQVKMSSVTYVFERMK